MSCNDDLSQLMPSLYSRVKLTLSADDTAELVQYQEQQQTNSQQTDVPATSNMLEPYAVLARGIAVPEQVGGQQSLTQSGHKHAKGTGRTVARRPFDLQLRSAACLFPCLTAKQSCTASSTILIVQASNWRHSVSTACCCKQSSSSLCNCADACHTC